MRDELVRYVRAPGRLWMKLLTPGPVTTRPEVKAAMAQDIAPWDNDFRPIYENVRSRLLKIAGGTLDTHVALALQGCGHFAMEAAIRTFIPAGGKILIPLVGSYADRMAHLAKDAGRVPVPLRVDQERPVPPSAIAHALADDLTISHVGLVYSETGSGVVHDPATIGAAVRAAGRRLLVDAVSAFGALPLDVSRQPELEAVMFTSNKCLEAMPGLGFTVARTKSLVAAKGNAGSWSFDFADIFEHTMRPDGSGSFRFTPPAQVLSAVNTALDLFDAEGGQQARLGRYRQNADVLYEGVVALGLDPYLAYDVQGPIIVNVAAPDDPAWNLQTFVDLLKVNGWLISNFYNTARPSFRVGCIGAITPDDMRSFLKAVETALTTMGISNRRACRAVA